MNFHSAEIGALDALSTFETLRTPRGQAACDRLLAMIGLDTDDLDMAELHTDRASQLFARMSDPWGVIETKLLLAQIALVRHQPGKARTLLEESSRMTVEEAEARQHFLLTRAWLEVAEGDNEAALVSIEAAAEVFGQRTRAGDHTPHLLSRLARFQWTSDGLDRIDAWRTVLNDRLRRKN
jgi:hypothetical protein